jgi:hypothetical protein
MADPHDDNGDQEAPRDPSKRPEDATQDFVEAIANVLSHAINEPGLIQNVEKYFSPHRANIFNSDDEREDLTRHIEEFTDKFGRIDGFVILVKDETPPRQRVRAYPIDISNELARSFHVCRSAVCRLHMFALAVGNLRAHPNWFNMTEEHIRIYARVLEGYFWNALEIATIRLASYWDRVGQLLDFVFFNIRQYERDGFPVVLERIKKNFAPTFSEVVRDPNWKALVEYANSEKPSGLKWLLRRRNLAVHSTSFRPHEDQRDDALFEYEFNHYEARVIRDLVLKSPEEELEVIHLHLAKAAELFRGVFDFARLGLDLIEQDVTLAGPIMMMRGFAAATGRGYLSRGGAWRACASPGGCASP